MFNVDKLLKDLEEFNNLHQSELNPTQGEKDLMELKEAVAALKKEREEKAKKNKKAMQLAAERASNPGVDRYVALLQQKRKEFKENYY